MVRSVIDGKKVEEEGSASSVGKEMNGGESYAPKLSLNIKYEGTIKSIYVYYPSMNDEDFLVQKVSSPKKNIMNAIDKTANCSFMLNYTIGTDAENERIYIMITDKNDDYQIYCARIDKYDQLSVCSNPITVEVKSSDEIYELVRYKEIDYWCLQKDQIVEEVTEILMDRHNTK